MLCLAEDCQFKPLTTQEVNEAERLATRAVELGPTNDIALALAGNTLSYVLGDIRSGTDLTQRALDLNPNSAYGWLSESWNKHWNSEFDAAIESCRRAMRLSPQDPVMFHMQETTADCHFAAGRYEDALSWAAKALSGKPKSISAYVNDGRKSCHARSAELKPKGSRSSTCKWIRPFSCACSPTNCPTTY